MKKAFDAVTIQKIHLGDERELCAQLHSFNIGIFGSHNLLIISKQTWELIGKEMGWSK